MDWLKQLLDGKLIRPIDGQFGRFIALQEAGSEHIEQADQSLMLLMVLISVELGKQNVCLDLAKLDVAQSLGLNQSQGIGDIQLPDISTALAKLAQYRCISVGIGDDGTIASTPVVFHGNKLYLQRYWHYEWTLAQCLKQKLQQHQSFDMAMAAKLFNDLFVHQLPPGEVDWQKVACATALVKNFCVITGGPGTGKTTTVTNLLALISLLQSEQKPLIKLVTPTGKAAARLSESIKGAKARLNLTDEQKQRIPDEASTIHRLLGVKAHSSEFIHHKDNQLHVDVLVVDEVSMVDLPMMAKLMAALPVRCKVILLGDKDQLASVEAGSVLDDICASLHHGVSYSQALLAQIEPLTGLDIQSQCTVVDEVSLSDCICLLQKSHRFDDKSGIGQLAKAVNRGDWLGIKYLRQKDDADLRFADISPYDYRQLIEHSAMAYQPYLQMLSDGATAKAVITEFNRFQLLCALREGAFGVAGVNDAIEQQLVKLKLVDNATLYYPGKPIMISQNDYSLQLFNGDVGLILPDPQSGHLKAWFITPDGEAKSVYPNRLPNHDTVYAMTVHKSQGSEFDQVTMVLPPMAQVLNNKVISKELIYTGITRAKNRFNLYSDTAVLQRAIKQSSERASGLAELLYIRHP